MPYFTFLNLGVFLFLLKRSYINWISKIDKFRPSGVEELNINSPNTGIMFSPVDEYYHSPQPFAQTNTEYLVIQMFSILGRNLDNTNIEDINNPQIKPHTFFLNTTNSQIIYSDSFYSRFMVKDFGKIITIEHTGSIIDGNLEVWIIEEKN